MTILKLMNKIINKTNSNKYQLIIFIVLSCIPFLWLHNNNELFPAHGNSGLFFIFYDPSFILKTSPYLITSNNLGIPQLDFVFYPFSFIFSFIFKNVDCSYEYALILFYGINIFFSLLYFYLFILELLDNENNKKYIAIISAIFFVFNPISMFYLIFIENGSALYILPFTSSILYYFMKALKTKKFHYPLIVGLITSIFVIAINLVQIYFIPLILLILFLFIYETIIAKDYLNFKDNLIYIFKMLLIVIFINIWWIIPFLGLSFSNYSMVNNGFKNNFFNSYTNFNLFSTLGDLLSYLKNNIFRNYNYLIKIFHFEWWDAYYTNLFIIIGFFIFFIIIIPVIKNPKKYFMFMLLYLIGLYFAIGYSYPFKNFKIWLLKNLPFNILFSQNYLFFIIIVVSSSILFGIGSVIIYEFAKRKIGDKTGIIILSSLTVVSCLIYVFPMWSNNMFNFYVNYKDKKITSMVKIPYYYNHAKIFFNKNGSNINYNILTLPLFYPNINFNWHFGYYGGIRFNLLYAHSIIRTILPYPQAKLLVTLQNYRYIGLPFILGMFSSRYIVLQNDEILPKKDTIGVNGYKGLENYLQYISKYKLRYILNTSKGLKLVEKFGKLDIYKLSDKYFLFRIWTPERIIFANHELKLHELDNYMVPITMQNSFKVRTAVFARLFSQNRHSQRIKNYELNNIADKYSKQYSLTNKIWDMLASNRVLKISETVKKIATPTIEYKEINPSKYAVIVHNAKASFPLIFNLMYLKGWDVYPQVYPDKNITFKGNKFISKDINGTIQNNNIPNGHVFQTLLEKSLPAKYHFIANGYSNSWWINLNYIKKLGPQYYKVNKNGTIDFELIIDYWPQRLFYIGIIISGTTVIIFILYLIYDAVKKRKTK